MSDRIKEYTRVTQDQSTTYTATIDSKPNPKTKAISIDLETKDSSGNTTYSEKLILDMNDPSLGDAIKTAHKFINGNLTENDITVIRAIHDSNFENSDNTIEAKPQI